MKYQFICKNCKELFIDDNYIENRIYCSRHCAMINNPHRPRKTPLIFICRECKKEFINNGYSKFRQFCSKDCADKSVEVKNKIRIANLKEKSHFWKGGVSEIYKRIRAGLEFRKWREAVFQRDNWTCQKCFKKGGRLHPHHLKSFAYYPELRFELNNGLTLCNNCHYRTENYGRPNFIQIDSINKFL